MSEQNELRDNVLGRPVLLLALLSLAVAVPAARAQETGGLPAAPKAPANIQEVLKTLKESEKNDKARIREIEGIVFPVQDEIAQKLFYFNPGEFSFLRMQSEAGRSLSRFFEAQARIDQDSWAGVADAFDVAYEALKGGQLWVGREASLVGEDSALFGELSAKVNEAMAQRPDGAKLLAMIDERNKLLAKLKTSAPMMKYLGERRQWWQNYPGYIKAVEEESDKTR
ncbi:MAG: hypothetical protein SFU85_11955 [Candidatus Methylacidiphilales bacterium]|nr:hypothetical protein [Candidatus Methylacidiphilales bacterium]